ncbi:hypothetical protein [Candidatus Ruminimicrobiellum ovillum]|uniref:hypothetical protein n=1 Tax=Candidatus Ruminimicrobiellum ovillum TaxID=1947927 RepID=UPI00355AA9D7
MKSILKCALSFFILFSTIDLSVINLFDKFYSDMGNKTSISEIMEIECDLFYHAKNVVKTVCNNIAKDVLFLFAPTQNNKVFFDVDKSDKRIYIDNCFNYVKLVLPVLQTNVSFVLDNTKLMLFFFGFIFLFILRYLGLLFTFGKIVVYQQYKKAYII